MVDDKGLMMELINKYAKKIAERLINNLEALILVGSYSRGEEIEGSSDIEFWAVVKDLSRARKPKLDYNVSLGFTTREHLKKLKPYIYTVEVKKFGKIVFGDVNILNLIPNYDYKDIQPIDGFILLNNRIVEQLILLNRIEDKQSINQYEFDKGYIQLVNSLLVLNKRYKSLYPEKLDEFRKISKNNYSGLLNKVEEAFTSIKQQKSEIASVTACLPAGKACPRNDRGGLDRGVLAGRNDVNHEEALKKWLEIRAFFKKAWLDEQKTLGNLMCWIKILVSGGPVKYFVYQRAAKLYFSEGYLNRSNRNKMIGSWERFVK